MPLDSLYSRQYCFVCRGSHHIARCAVSYGFHRMEGAFHALLLPVLSLHSWGVRRLYGWYFNENSGFVIFDSPQWSLRELIRWTSKHFILVYARQFFTLTSSWSGQTIFRPPFICFLLQSYYFAISFSRAYFEINLDRPWGSHQMIVVFDA